MKIGVLATYDGILAGRYVAAMLDQSVHVDCVILDPKPVEPKDVAIHDQRTRGRLPPILWHEFVAAKIPMFAVPSHNDACMQLFARERGLDLLVNAGTPRILSEATLKSVPIGVLNCHPGLLPAYRGASCVEWALLHGDPVGNAVHLMSTDIDKGPLLMSEPVPIDAVMSYSQIRVAVYEAGFKLMARACRDLLCGAVRPGEFTAQDGGRYHKPIDPQSMSIVLSRYPEPV